MRLPVIDLAPAGEWSVERWFGTDTPLTLADLRGHVVVLEAFQMLCPGCVSHALPQAQRVRASFSPDDVAVIGLHTVFEHHDVMGPAALQAFLHEYRIDFPVGVDQPSETDATPLTMARYQLRGTPSTLLFDRAGRLRAQHFGAVPDLQLGAEIGALVVEAAERREVEPVGASGAAGAGVAVGGEARAAARIETAGPSAEGGSQTCGPDNCPAPAE